MLKSMRRLYSVKRPVFRFLLPAALILTAASVLLLAVPVSHALLYLLYFVFAVALPGTAAVRLFKIRLSLLENLAACCGMGLLSNILVYFMLSPFGLGRIIPYAIGVLSLLSAFALIKIRPAAAPADDPADVVGLCFAVFTAAATFLLLSAATLTPDTVGARGYYHDLTNGVALVTSAYNGFPMEFLQMAGTPHFYHPFFYAFCAVVKHCLGFASFEIATKFSLLVISPLFAASFAAVAGKIFKRRLPIVISAAALLLFSYDMIYYIHVDLLGFPLGLAFSSLSLLFFFRLKEEIEKWYPTTARRPRTGSQPPKTALRQTAMNPEKNKIKADGREAAKIDNRALLKLYVLSLLFLIGAVGAKGPIGVITVFGICFSLLLDFFRNRRFSRAAAIGLPYAAAFFAAYFLLYQQGPESMALRAAVGQWAGRGAIFESLPAGWPSSIRDVVTAFVFTVETQPVMAIALLVLAVYLAVMRRNPRPFVDCAFGGLLAGFILFNMFAQTGSSEVYFVLAFYPLALLASVFAISRFFAGKKRRGKIILGALFAAVLCPVLAIQLFGAVSNTASLARDSLSHSRFSVELRTAEQIAVLEGSERSNALTPAEYEGLLWLRDHGSGDAVVAEARHFVHNKYFYGTAFGERRFYLEGWGYVTMDESNENVAEKNRRDGLMTLFYKNEDETFIPLLRQEGIRYIIIYDYINPGWRLQNAYGSATAFENAEIAIYDINP